MNKFFLRKEAKLLPVLKPILLGAKNAGKALIAGLGRGASNFGANTGTVAGAVGEAGRKAVTKAGKAVTKAGEVAGRGVTTASDAATAVKETLGKNVKRVVGATKGKFNEAGKAVSERVSSAAKKTAETINNKLPLNNEDAQAFVESLSKENRRIIAKILQNRVKLNELRNFLATADKNTQEKLLALLSGQEGLGKQLAEGFGGMERLGDKIYDAQQLGFKGARANSNRNTRKLFDILRKQQRQNNIILGAGLPATAVSSAALSRLMSKDK